MINRELISDFRDLVNSNNSFIYDSYKNRDGKNNWNLICSCMDWIDVSVDYLSNQYISNKDVVSFKGDNVNTKCMIVYTYISAIDIIFESISQLHRVIIRDKKKPFKDKRGIFNDYSICPDDNEYFKEIRAVFGAHPVHLNRETVRFASWPTDHVYTEYDYAAMLYESNVDGEKQVFGFRFKELNEFLISRYNYLTVLSKVIEDEYQKHKEEQHKKKIKDSEIILEQILIFKNELEERFDSEYINEELDILEVYFNVKCTKSENIKIVNEYLVNCSNELDNIKKYIQTMGDEDYIAHDIISPRAPVEIQYEFSKLYSFLRGVSNDFNYKYNLKTVTDFLQYYITIDEDMKKSEVLLLVSAGLNSYWKDKKMVE